MGEKDKIVYKSITKGTALLGSVQVFNVLINVLKGKVVAMFLGASGMGIYSLLNTSVLTIQQFTSLGLNLSIVKEVANANGKEIFTQKNVIQTIRTVLLLTALLGMVLTMCLSPIMSNFTFGSSDYIFSYVALGAMVFFTTLSNGECSILQGAQALKRLAFSSLVGSSVGLLVGGPLYFFYGTSGIVPALISLSIATFLFYNYHSRKLFGWLPSFRTVKSNKILIKRLISLGVIFMGSSLIGTIVNYLVNTFIRNYGGVEDVGFFQAANSITNQYVGLLFAAMGMDFFPRLAAIADDNDKVRDMVNAQLEIIILLISPVIMMVIVIAPFLIKVLLTEEFFVLVPLIRIMALGIFFKAIAFPMGYISFAKGDKKTFFGLEGVFGNALMLLLNVVFYKLFGLVGLGFSFVITYLVFTLVYLIITGRLYKYKVKKDVVKQAVILGLILMVCFLCSLSENLVLTYVGMSFSFVIGTIYCLYELNNKLEIKEWLLTKLYRIGKRK